MFFDIIKSVILGVVEGVTEFLPISSTGHLIILNQWISFDENFTKLFDVFIQLGAILAAVVYFWHRIWPFGRSETDRKIIFDTWKKAAIGVMPAIIIGGVAGKKIQESLFNPWVVAIALIIGGVVLIMIDRKEKEQNRIHSVAQIKIKDVILIGLAQCLAMIPGTSRSASTIVAALLLGASRVVAVEFSFFLAIPTMLAASAYSLLKHGISLNYSEISILAVGFFVSFIVALSVIRYFLRFIEKNNFRSFGYYRIALGILVLIIFFNV
jgi:undecaprenyl-diphosphatase